MSRIVYAKETLVAAVLWCVLFAGSLWFGDANLTGGQGVPGLPTGLSKQPLVAALSIFMNNITVAGMLAIGAVTGGLLTAGILALNGAVLGAAVSRSLLVGLSPSTVALLILPHCTEIFGFWVAAGVGFRGFGFVLTYIRRPDNGVAAEVPQLYRTLILATLLVAVGAFMEAYVSIPMALRLTQ